MIRPVLIRGFEPVGRELANGLRVRVLRRDENPLVALHAYVEADQRFEAPGKSGLSCLVGMLLDEGTETRTGHEIATAIESVGGILEATGTGLRLQVLGRDLDLAFELMADILMHPAFRPGDLAKEKEKLLADIGKEMDDPKRLAHRRFDALVYGEHPYAHASTGDPGTVAALGRDDVVRFHAERFRPAATIVSAAGDVDPVRVIELVERHFGSWPAARAEPPVLPAIERQREVRRERVRVDREQVQILLGHLGIRRRHPDFPALTVLDHVLGLGAGFTDRISRKLRDEQGLAYSVYATISETAGKEPGTFQAYIGTAPENETRAIEGFLAEIRRIRSEPVGKDELAAVLAYLTGSYCFNFESAGQIAYYLTFLARYGLDVDYVNRYPQELVSVGPEEILAAAVEHLDPDHYTLVTVGPA